MQETPLIAAATLILYGMMLVLFVRKDSCEYAGFKELMAPEERLRYFRPWVDR